MSGIFISYRRTDNPDATGRIYDRLVSEFGKAEVFKDVDSIPLGQDFRGYLNDIVGDCGVVLVIIGPRWSDARNQAGQRRLEDPDDFVRIELEAAMARDIPVVPVLVGLARIPAASDLPASLAPMAFRQSIEVRPDPDFHHDATRLVSALRGILHLTAAAPELEASAITVPAAVVRTQRSRPLGWIVALVAVLGMALLTVPAIRYLRLTPPPESRVDIVTPATAEPYAFALSPDGRQIVFVASGDGASRLWLRLLATTKAQPLAGTEGATYPFWSPDSRSIGFFANGALKRLDLGGGAQQTLADVLNGVGGTWNAAGVILIGRLGPSGGPVLRVSATGGAAEPATTMMPKQISQFSPFFLPDGHRFLFSAVGPEGTAGIFLGDLAGGAARRLTDALSAAAYLPSGWVLWEQDGALVAQRLDLSKAALAGARVTLAGGLPSELPAGTVRVASVSATGLMAYRVGWETTTRFTWFDRSGTAQGSDDPLGNLPRVAPDGGRILASVNTGGPSSIWLRDGSHVSRLTYGEANDYFGLWSPDGSRIVFGSSRSGGWDLYQKLVNGAVGGEQPILSQDKSKVSGSPTSWSADGRFLLYVSTDQQSGDDLWVMPMVGAPKPAIFLRTPFNETGGVFSPDGRWVAYQSNQSGRNEIYVRPFRAPDAKNSDTASEVVQWQVSTTGGTAATWRPDGKEIFFLDPSGAMMAAPVTVSGARFASGAPVKLFQTRMPSLIGPDSREYDVAPDGRFLINTVSDTVTTPITLVLNWNPEAKP